MTGAELRALRVDMGLDVQEMALFLGIHLTSVYRAESLPTPKLEGAHARLIARVSSLTKQARKKVGLELKEKGWPAAWVLLLRMTSRKG